MATVKQKTQSKSSKQLSKLKLEFLEYYLKLPIQKLAAASIGKSEDTIIRWKKNDAYFADQMQAKKAEWALDKVVKVKKTEWLLERIMKEYFAEKKEVEHSTSEKLDEALDRISRLLP